MDAQQVQAAFEDVFDQALVFHGFADFSRDYDLYVYIGAAPSIGVVAQDLRYRFTHCVSAVTTTSVSPEVWRRSLDDRLTQPDGADVDELDGFVWGVRWQVLYPGLSVVADSPEAAEWSERLGMDFFEVLVETNTHTIRLIATDLVVTALDAGHTPFAV
ncbi:HalD/BesD family halogenase [Micromonospora sp. WMMD736]|uniref:YxiG-like protein n=1 Tax=Micromonospora sp. WMMD736 TaxID=3404112 RepID=UPI003B945FBB